MKRSIFFIITAVVAILFGGMMLLTPAMTSENFGLETTPESTLLFRSLGGMVLSLGLLNFLVRNEPDSKPLQAVLMVNMVSHIISMGNDFYGASQGILEFSKLAGGMVAHVFIVVGSAFYLLKMKS
ncbi:MAG TPA: hypothetical protein PKM27_15790 [Saprospiraceae bacterium]|nr:hypothetical protein [Saprospiraceae bacterium]HNT21790.1 hypothetical protein [Saprospiraceae bacterium]